MTLAELLDTLMGHRQAQMDRLRTRFGDDYRVRFGDRWDDKAPTFELGRSGLRSRDDPCARCDRE